LTTPDPLGTRSVRRASDSVQTAFWETRARLLGADGRLLGERSVDSSSKSLSRHLTCCLFSSFKTLLTSTEGIALASDSTSRVPGLLAGFQVIMYGRFWVITEDEP
jgi:hypothetical protein